MASKYITGTYNAGYTLTGAYSEVTIGTSGSIGGAGLMGGTNSSYAITNLGRIAAATTLASGIRLRAGGTIINGNTADTTALIAGGVGSDGTPGGDGGVGIRLADGGSIGNWGTIAGGKGGSVNGAGGAAIILSGGGAIGNGGTGDLAALIVGGARDDSAAGGPANRGGYGISLAGSGSIDNWGTIAGGGVGSSNYIGAVGGGGIALSDRGSISNWGTIAGGSGGSIVGGGGTAITLTAGGSIGNWGTVAGGSGGSFVGAGGVAIILSGGGTITNGSTSDTTALIAGGRPGPFAGDVPGAAGIILSGGGTIGNWGTIAAGEGGPRGGDGGIGVSLSGGGTIANRGIITGADAAGAPSGGSGFGSDGGAGVDLPGGGSIANQGIITGGAGGYSTDFTGGIGSSGVRLSGGGTISNSGAITGGEGGRGWLNAGGPGPGISLDVGSISNSGTITGGPGGIGSRDAGSGGAAGVALQSGSISNSGTIVGGNGGFGIYGAPDGGAGVRLVSGNIGNFGTIVGGKGGGGAKYTGAGGAGILFFDVGSIGNLGTIASGSAGAAIILSAGGVVTNGSAGGGGALIAGGIGIQALGTAGSTVINFGTIAGAAGGSAISFGGGTDRLIIEPGAKFIGGVDGGPGTDALEFAAGSGSLVGLGTSVVNFGTLVFDPGASWTVEGNANSFSLLVTGFTVGDVIDVDSFAAVSDSYTGSGLVLTDAVNNTVTLAIQGSFSTGDFTIFGDGHGGTNVITCFCRGTLILTERGEVPVEELAVGERVKTLSGKLRPIVWIGFGRDLVTRANKLARPIIVRAGALVDGVPHRDLYLTHGHALYFDGALMPVENLVNHHSILWDEAARVVEYYHLELADHDVVLANGAPAETYYDADNRALFHNTRPGSAARGPQRPCVPVLSGGEIVERVWAGLFARSGGHIETDTTADPDLHLVVDGRRLDPASADGSVYTFRLEQPPAGSLRLCSRSGVPSLLGVTAHDHRALGVAIEQIVIDCDGIPIRFDYDMPQLREGGCYPAEDGFSWTDGDFALPARFFTLLGAGFTLLVRTRPLGLRYPAAQRIAQAA